MAKRDFVKNAPPNLSAESAGQFAEHIIQVLADSKEAGLTRGYSLVTKFHHFSFPDSFVMYDNYVASSIQMWAYFSFEEREGEHERFTYGHLSDKSGSGYKDILEFYLNLFKIDTEGMAEVEDWSKELTKEFGFRITSLDLVDKFLWTECCRCLLAGSNLDISLGYPLLLKFQRTRSQGRQV